MMRIGFRLIGCLIISLAIFALAGCGDKTRAESAAAEELPGKLTQVAILPVAAADLAETFTLPGTLEAWEDLALAAETAGSIRWIGPGEGERVRKGEEILRIDPETARANLDRTEAEFAVQEKRLQRMQQLLEQKFVSQQEYDETQKAFTIAKAERARARVALDKSTLISPVDGVIDRLPVDRGEYVAEGALVAVLVQVDRLKVLVEVPEKDVSFLKVGQQVEVLPAAIAGRDREPRKGEIIHLSYKADPATRTYLAKIEVSNRDGGLRPGMITRVEFLRRRLPEVIAVPLYAVVERAGEKVVFVEEEGVARMRPVRTGAVLGDRIVIEEGLAPGDRLLVKGQQLVGDGTKIQESGARSQRPKPEV